MSSVTDTAEKAATHVTHAATRTRASIVDLGAQALRLINDLRVAEVRGGDSLLRRVGLQRRESALRPLLWFAAGAAAGGAIVFVLAPTQGKKIREQIMKTIEERGEKRRAAHEAPPPAEEPQPAAPLH